MMFYLRMAALPWELFPVESVYCSFRQVWCSVVSSYPLLVVTIFEFWPLHPYPLRCSSSSRRYRDILILLCSSSIALLRANFESRRRMPWQWRRDRIRSWRNEFQSSRASSPVEPAGLETRTALQGWSKVARKAPRSWPRRPSRRGVLGCPSTATTCVARRSSPSRRKVLPFLVKNWRRSLPAGQCWWGRPALLHRL